MIVGAAAALALVAWPAGARADHGLTELVSVGANGAYISTFVGSSADGSRAFFETQENISPSDTDTGCSSSTQCIDVYERSGGMTTLVSTGPTGGSGSSDADFKAVSDDGTRVLFQTAERLTADDTDSQSDVYERAGGVTTLVSTGPLNANGPSSSALVGSSRDGTRVFFLTSAALVPTDMDGQVDVYERSGGTTTLISTGPNDGGSFSADFLGASADGTRVFFETRNSLVAGDTDACGEVVPAACVDIYERSGGTTTLVSTGPASTNDDVAADFMRNSEDGTRVFFRTQERLVTQDADGRFDVYERSAGTTALVSTGSIGGNGNINASFGGISRDGTRVFFLTSERLEPADFDGSIDVYERAGATTQLISTPPASGGHGTVEFGGASADGTHVFFRTPEQLTADDDDGSGVDVYERHAGVTTLVSRGPLSGAGTFNATFSATSDDGSRVFFMTAESLVPTDYGGNDQDIYERAAGATTLISTGPKDGHATSFQPPRFGKITPTGTLVFFDMQPNIASPDSDNCGFSVEFHCTDAYVAKLGYARAKGATPVRVSLVPAFTTCDTPNREHGPPLAFGSCAPPAQTSASLTMGTPDANGAPANFTAFVRFGAIAGLPGPPDDSDITINVGLTDVRCQTGVSPCGPSNTAAGADYTGELRGVTSVRLTDRNGGAAIDAVTTEDFPFALDFTCAPTASTAEGAACSATTSVNALMPGAVVDAERAIWQLGEVQVLDGGADGETATTPNAVFAVQGLFVP